MEKEFEQEMLRSLSILEAGGKLRGKKIYIFGHCDASEQLIDLLLERGLTVLGIADNNPAKCGMVYRGVSVAAPNEYLLPVNEDTEILVVSKHYPSMNRQLIDMGYAGHIHRLVDFNTFSEYSLDESVFVEKTARVRNGVSILKRMREKYPDEFLVVCPYNALGDVYMVLTYLPAYIARHGITDFAALVTGNGCMQTAKMFDVLKLEMLPRGDMETLVQALIFMNENNSIVAHHDRPYTNWNIRFSNHNKFSMDQHFKVSVFGLDINTEPVFPKHREYSGTFPFPKGKSVILAPYAKSVVALSEEFWLELVRRLTGQGYAVITNISNDEAPLPDTIPLSMELSDTLAAAEWAGHFIGLRSGLCDVMRHARCKKVVLYPDCIYSTTKMKTLEFAKICEDNTMNIACKEFETVFSEISKGIRWDDSVET